MFYLYAQHIGLYVCLQMGVHLINNNIFLGGAGLERREKKWFFFFFFFSSVAKLKCFSCWKIKHLEAEQVWVMSPESRLSGSHCSNCAGLYQEPGSWRRLEQTGIVRSPPQCRRSPAERGRWPQAGTGSTVRLLWLSAAKEENRRQENGTKDGVT